MSGRIVHDVSRLPRHGFGARSLVWWGTLGFIAIETTGFVLAFATYFYLRSQVVDWPPQVAPPGLLWSSIFTGVAILSELPNFWVKRVARREDARATRLGVIVMFAIGLVLIGIRFLQFGELHCRWDSTAYGSIVWTLFGLHTFHLLTDVTETGVIVAVVLLTPMVGRRFVDVSENAEYWDFVVATWVAVYLVVYWAPRLIGGWGQ
jgi:heme/copper-type cytochrome/quinol oxidase subunit 3